MQRSDVTPPPSVATLPEAAQSPAQKKINRRSLDIAQRKIFDAQCVRDNVKKSYSFDQGCDGDIVAKIVEDRFAGAIARKVQLASEKNEKLKTHLKSTEDESFGEQSESNDSSTSDKCAVIENNERKSQFGFKLLSDYINSRKQDNCTRFSNCDIRNKNSVNNGDCHSYNKPLLNSNKVSALGKSQLNSVGGGAEDVIGRDRAPVHLRQRASGNTRNIRCRSSPPWGGSLTSPWASEKAGAREGAEGRLCRTWYGGYGTLYETEDTSKQRILTQKTVPVTTVAALNGGTSGGQQDGGSGGGSGGARRRVEGRRRPRPPPSPRLSASALSLNILPRLSAAVIPLKRGDLARSAATLLEDGPLLAPGPTLRKCETMVALGEPQRAVNRLRVCSRCSSLLSLAGGGSRYSLAGGGFVPVSTTSRVAEEGLLCKLCLEEVPKEQVMTISHCSCCFCTKCMQAYAEYEIMNGAYDISCPDSRCSRNGVMAQKEVESLVNAELVDKYRKFRLNHEVAMDGARAFCPRVGCETVCHIGSCGTVPGSATSPQAVRCPTCDHNFCSACTNQWHEGMDCAAFSRQQAMLEVVEGLPAESDLIKWCPMCRVPIEKDEGCAQMMCKRCKHVFCWYCLASLDDDFLLRHYDKGPCKNKLGHSRASVIWHRAQVLGIFAGFGLLLLVASPLLLLAAPCIVCCKCRLCNSNGGKTIDGDDLHAMDIDPEDGTGDEIQKLNSPAFD